MELAAEEKKTAQDLFVDVGAGSDPDAELATTVTQDAGQTTETTYSKISVWLMLIFMSIATGSDGYNASVIGNVELLFAVMYPDALTDAMYSRLSNAFLIGMIVGMILFGYVADQFGRKTGAIATTILLTLGIVISTAANGTTPTGLLWMLVIGRGVAGVGAGGEYPVTGAGAMEATDESKGFRKRRGFIFAIMSEVAANLGYCFGALVPLILLLCVHQRVDRYELVWRLSFGLGVLPTLVIFWFRMRMAVTSAFRKSAMRKQKVPYLLIIKKYWRRLLAGGWTWFIYNWISIPFGVFSSTVVSKANVGDSLIKNLGWGVVINSFYVPGPFIGGILVDKIGRRQTMALGFALQAILGFILGGAYDKIQNVFPLFVVIYGIFLTLGELGPGSVIALVSAEPFPTSIRGQSNGLISAWAKAGAAIGTQVFTSIQNKYSDDAQKGNQVVFLIGSAFAVLGAVVTWVLVEDVDRNLDNEDEIWKAYLAEHGWEASWGDHETKDPAKALKQPVERTS